MLVQNYSYTFKTDIDFQVYLSRPHCLLETRAPIGTPTHAEGEGEGDGEGKDADAEPEDSDSFEGVGDECVVPHCIHPNETMLIRS